MIKSQKIEVTISNNAKFYVDLGFEKLKQGDKILVDVFCLPKNSNKQVEATCDECSFVFKRKLQSLSKNEKHLCFQCSRKSASNKNKGNTWGFTSLTKGENHPRWNPNKKEFAKYKAEVVSITRNQPIETLKNFEKPRGLCGVEGAYQLDHLISIKEGFEKQIPAHIIGNLSNLRFIPWEQNRQKSDKTILTEELLQCL